MEAPAINIEHLHFQYAGQPPLFQNLHLAVPQGERFGLFGPNGAGKTTLMSLLTGLLSFNNGDIQLLGHSIKQKNTHIKTLFGYVPQDYSFYEELTPLENLEFFGAWYGLTRAESRNRAAELFEVLNIGSVQKQPVKKFSGGMKRKVNLVIGVMHNPKLLFLDEPTVGVDVQTRHEIIHYLKRLNAKGTTLVYTSHQLNEAEELCNRIAMINAGKIIAFNTLDNLLAEHKQDGLEGLFLHLTGQKFS